MRKAYSYVRFSTPDQAKGDSFRRQTEFSIRYAEKHGLLLDETTSLRDLGVSAFRGSNVKEGALAGFLELTKGGKIPKGSVLIVESLDRLSRDQIRPALQLFLGILDAGVSIVTLQPEREYTPNDQDPLVLIEPLIYFSRAHEESATKSRRVGESWDQRRRAAAESQTPMTTVGPKWLVQEEGQFVEVADRVRLVKEIFKWTLEGMGTYAVVTRLTEAKVPGWGPKGKWNTAYVRLILTDRRVLGEYQPKKLVNGKMQNQGEPIADYYPRVISDRDFYEALGTIKRRKGKAGRGGAGRENVLSGLVYNAEDGSKMYYGTHRNRKPFLESAAAYYGEERPKGRSFPYLAIESAVLEILECEIATVPEYTEHELKLLELRGRLHEVQGRLERLLDRATVTPDFDLFLDAVSVLEREKQSISKQIGEQIAVVTTSTARQEATGGLVQMWKTLAGPTRSRLAVVIRDRIVSCVESVWLLIVREAHNRKVAHIQVYLRDGRRLYRQSHTLEATSAPDFTARDFRLEAGFARIGQ